MEFLTKKEPLTLGKCGLCIGQKNKWKVFMPSSSSWKWCNRKSSSFLLCFFSKRMYGYSNIFKYQRNVSENCFESYQSSFTDLCEQKSGFLFTLVLRLRKENFKEGRKLISCHLLNSPFVTENLEFRLGNLYSLILCFWKDLNLHEHASGAVWITMWKFLDVFSESSCKE